MLSGTGFVCVVDNLEIHRSLQCWIPCRPVKFWALKMGYRKARKLKKFFCFKKQREKYGTYITLLFPEYFGCCL